MNKLIYITVFSSLVLASGGGKDIELDTEVSPLCGFCSHIESCPRFEAEEVPELVSAVDELQKMQEEEKNLQGRIKPHKAKLFNIVKQRGAIKTGSRFLRKANRSRKYLVMDRLETFLADHGSSIDEFQETRSFSFLEIKKAKSKAA